MRANEELNRKTANGNGNGNGTASKGVDLEYDPFAEDAKPIGPPVVHKVCPANSEPHAGMSS